MRRTACLLAVIACLAWTMSATAQWTDVTWTENFDAYSPGDLTPQSNWDLWYGSGSTAEPKVKKNDEYSAPHSLQLIKENDVVWDFAVNPPPGGLIPSSGQWTVSVKTFVPTGVTGEFSFINLSIYDEPNKKTDWAVQIGFSAFNDTVTYDGNTGNKQKLPLLRDQWVTLSIAIDFDNDRVDVLYGNQRLVDHASYINGTGGSGLPQLQAIDVYGGTAQRGIKGGAVYFENLCVESALNSPLLTESSPNPVIEGSNITLDSWAPSLPNGLGVVFLTGMDDQPLLAWVPVFLLNLDSAGWNSSQMLIPIGTKGYSFQGRIFAADLSSGPPYVHALGSTFSMEVN